MKSFGFQSSTCMAKNRAARRRKFRRYLKGIVNLEMNFLAIAAKAANIELFGDTVVEKTWVSSLVCDWTLSNMTLPVAGAGPVLVGVAHSDYSVAEIEEFIENLNSWNEGDLVQQEIAKRKIRIVGSFDFPDSAQHSTRLANGAKIRTKLGWSLSTGQTIQAWVYNPGTQSFSGSTTAIVGLRGHANLWPQ